MSDFSRMTSPIVSSTEPVALVGGGVVEAGDLAEVMALSKTLVAADGGVSKALTEGIMPAAVIGDFDSIADADRSQVPSERLHHIGEQDSTDFDKAIRHIDAPVLLAVGFTGARIDHQLAALHTLVMYPERPCVLINGAEVLCLLPPRIDLPTEEGDVISLMPLGPVQGRSDGLCWPIAGLAFDPLSKIGTSNRATGPIRLEMDAPRMLGIFPRKQLAALTRALAAAPPGARWPVP